MMQGLSKSTECPLALIGRNEAALIGHQPWGPIESRNGHYTSFEFSSTPHKQPLLIIDRQVSPCKSHKKVCRNNIPCPKANTLILFVTLPIMAVAGIVLVILSCALYERYLPLVVFPFILLAPLPTVMISSMAGGPLSTGPSQAARESSLFISTCLAASALIVPFFLHHLNKIPLYSALLASGGTLLLFLTVVIYQFFFNSDESECY